MRPSSQEPPTLDPAALLEEALEAIRAQRFDAAETQLRRVLAVFPQHPAATHVLGILRHQQGRSEDGIALVRKSIALTPEIPDWHNDLGNMLAEAQRDDEAVAAFMAALQLNAGNAVVWNNLGALLLRGGQLEEALLAFENAIALDPGFEDALNNLGNTLARLGRTEEAARCFCAAYIQRPVAEKPRQMLGIAYYTLGRIAEAVHIYRLWLQEEPGNPIAEHMLAACSGQQVPDRASNAYIEAHFDDYAKTFETRLVDSLAYRIPQRIGMILGELSIPAGSLKVLDAGCGTGLCGTHLRQFAKSLVGVDLSAQCLAVAAGKNLYDTLVKAELVEHLSGATGTCDLIVIADTLIYFGSLEKLFQAAANALDDGGLLIATVEELAPAHGDFAFNPSGRYSHSHDYMVNVLMRARLECSTIESVEVRMELGIPVKGLLIVARKQA